MKANLRIFALLVLSTFLGLPLLGQELPTADPGEVGLSEERLKRMGSVFQGYVDKKQMAGSVMLIARKGKVAYFEAFGKSDIENDVPMKKDAIFRIASQTKALVSVGIMILQEEGKLLINEQVSKYIPEFEGSTVSELQEDSSYVVVPANRPITIRDLLTHTAGIGYGWGVAADQWKEAGIVGWYFANRDEQIGATVARLAKLPMETHPGEKFVYGYNTDILGVVIEKVSGKPLDEFIKTRVTEPLGMDDTHFYLPETKIDRLSTVYSAYEDKPLERSPDPGQMVGQGAYVNGPRKSFSGGAGLLSTATDYYKFLQAMLNGGILNGNRILSPKTVELMTVNHIGDLQLRDGMRFGLGFSVIDDLGRYGEPASEDGFGWGGAYGSTYWVDPQEELVVVYFKQLIPTNDLDDQAKLRALVYAAIVE